MAKSDIEDAFRIVPLSPEDYHVLGFKWKGQYYYDMCLSMWASSSCQIFEFLSPALEWIVYNNYAAAGISHILDDFFFIGPPNSDKCSEDLARFLYLCKKLGIPIKDGKTETPRTVIKIYGIEVDSSQFVCRLPCEKVEKIRNKLKDIKIRKKIQLKELQSLIGLLNFTCLVV